MQKPFSGKPGKGFFVWAGQRSGRFRKAGTVAPVSRESPHVSLRRACDLANRERILDYL